MQPAVKGVESKDCVWGPVNIRSPADKSEEMRYLDGQAIAPYYAGSALTWGDQPVVHFARQGR